MMYRRTTPVSSTYLLLFCDTSVCNSCCIVVDGLLIMSTSMDALLEGVNAEFGGIKQQVPPRPRPSPHLLSPGLLILTRVQLHLPQSWECPWDQRAVCPRYAPPQLPPLLPPSPTSIRPSLRLGSHLAPLGGTQAAAPRSTCPWETMARTQSTSQGLGQAWGTAPARPGEGQRARPSLSPALPHTLAHFHCATVAPSDLAPAAPHPAL